MKIVFLDAGTLGEFDLAPFQALGQVELYNFSTDDQVAARVVDADVIITNKVKINKNTLGDYEKVKLVCVAATGTDILDKDFLDQAGIKWTNVAGYSTDSVAQLTFTLLLYVMMNSRYFDDYVKDESYANSQSFTNVTREYHEINGKTWGIIGLGEIGRKVADIAKAFGANVVYYSTSGKNANPNYQQVDFDTLLSQSDIISLHCPLTEQTRNIINKDALAKMKPSTILINVGRGPLVNQEDVAQAIENNQIRAYGTDVLNVEPIAKDNPLNKIKDSEKLFITPHIAWASIEARKTLMQGLINNIKEFYSL